MRYEYEKEPLTDINDVVRFLKQSPQNPYYDFDTDYTTNSSSYYDYLAKLKPLIQILAERIYDYDRELAKRFEEWDKNLEELPDELKRMFLEWVDDGTLARILAQLLLDDYATKEEVNELLELLNSELSEDINSNTELIKQTKKDIDKEVNESLELLNSELSEDINENTGMIKQNKKYIDDELLIMNNDINYFKTSVNERINNFSNINGIEVLENITELNEKYPNGSGKIIVLKSDNHFYYYDENVWKKGNEFIQSNYKLVNNDGSMINLNLSDEWKNNPDITTLDTGFYVAYLQNENLNENYPVAKNIPKEIEGNLCTIKVYNYHIDDRVDYEITRNFTGDTFTASMLHDGTMTEWGVVLRTTDSKPLQQYRLTYSSGDIPPLSRAHEDIESTQLTVPITELKTGFYYGQIREDKTIDRHLPHDIIYGSYYTFIVYRNNDNRVYILLSDMSSGRTWSLYTLPNETYFKWQRLDKESNMYELDMYKFSHKINTLKDDTVKHFIMTDTHVQHLANTRQVADTNFSNFYEFLEISKQLKHVDYDIHLGDWVDGNFEKENTLGSIIKTTSDFYSKENRLGIYGNHDFNAQWNGYAGQNAIYNKDFERILTKEEMISYFTPKNKRDYYSIVDNKNKIKMIFLNTFDISYMTSDLNMLISDPLRQSCIGSKQIKWLINELNTVDTDYNVIIYTHDALNNVFTNNSNYWNGDAVREILETYQNKKSKQVTTTGITETNREYSYYHIDELIDFTNSNGKILSVVNGHLHEDKYLFKNGIRYISLLCSKAESGTTIEKPKRDFNNILKNALSVLEYDIDNEVINIYRYGANIDFSVNMFKLGE